MASSFSSDIPIRPIRLGGLDDMIISLYAGEMTVRDNQHHLATRIGTELSHETISKITDAVLDEVAAWQTRPLKKFYPIVHLDALVIKIRDGHQVRNRAGPEGFEVHGFRSEAVESDESDRSNCAPCVLRMSTTTMFWVLPRPA